MFLMRRIISTFSQLLKNNSYLLRNTQILLSPITKKVHKRRESEFYVDYRFLDGKYFYMKKSIIIGNVRTSGKKITRGG